MIRFFPFAVVLVMLGSCALVPTSQAPGTSLKPAPEGRTIQVSVAAIDQPLVYNRFGSVNPYGMIYALERDLVDAGDGLPVGASTCPGDVRLRPTKRPRPLVLRVNEGDVLEIRFRNRLLAEQPERSRCNWRDLNGVDPETRRYRAEYPYARDYGALGEPDSAQRDPPRPFGSAFPVSEPEGTGPEGRLVHGVDWPRTRLASITVAGMTPLAGRPCDAEENDWSAPPADSRVSGLRGIPPGACFVYRYRAERTGTHLFFSNAAPSGGEGDGGSLVHGLFGAVHVEPRGSRWFRSQVRPEELQIVRAQAARPALLDYEGQYSGMPVLEMLRPVSGERGTWELIHGDLTAIVADCLGGYGRHPRCRGRDGRPKAPAFREFTVIFHDELKTFYADAFQELAGEYMLEGVGDGFAINYGASGMGTLLLANRKEIGPAARCLECLYEEFFLQSWANGDPALLPGFLPDGRPAYADDPSNVYHSYLGDRVEFRNLHAGPKETHVFHLHAHQWLAQRADAPESETGTYLDSQTIAPQQGFSYAIHYGGSGNRNVTPGDSIFHCHLYPHFAQGMWALWRVHDVFEDGTRFLPDGELGPGTDPFTGRTGRRSDPLVGRSVASGTPIPALIPLPGQALPPAPTYGEAGFPGYPFYIPGRPGHRAPQPPLDLIADGGLPRHVFTGEGTRTVSHLSPEQQEGMTPESLLGFALQTGDFSAELERAGIETLRADGEPEERRAMDVHAARADGLLRPDGRPMRPHGRGYLSVTPEGRRAHFTVNGHPPQPGAPFADPCVADSDGRFQPLRTRRYEVAAIQLDLVVNEAGWHDPQARVNVLKRRAAHLENTTTAEVEPFFFRAESGECIEFFHTNRTPKELALDDFQVQTPTDTIGQHIHLVKFDVTASDGSGNGFNYEDGTLAADAVLERLCAAHRFGGWRPRGRSGLEPLPAALDLGRICETPHPDLEPFHQTTAQRWYADPLTGSDTGTDRTIRTVFTHDHFAPSSIQQHGFYAALLVEPAGSRWLKEDGTRLCDGQRLDNGDCDGQDAVGSRALIVGAKDGETHPDHREFALAVADFALLYAPRAPESGAQGGLPADQPRGIDALVSAADTLPEVAVQRLRKRRDALRHDHGVPVAPPRTPEAISKNHHDPYVVNYRNAPLPIRLSKEGGSVSHPAQPCPSPQRLAERVKSFPSGGFEAPSPRRPAPAGSERGNPANVFNSWVHGDPCTPVLEAYEGERIQIRMVQGAQEVQHVFSVEGLRWPREVGNPASPLVSAQEIGISEHFEMAIPPLSNVALGDAHADYLWRFTTQDEMWNGIWGLLRIYDGAGAYDRTRVGGAVPAQVPEAQRIGRRLAWVEGVLTGMPAPEIQVDNAEDFYPARQAACPGDAPSRLFVVEAWTVRDWLESGLLFYDRGHSIADWNALVFLPVYSKALGPADQVLDLDFPAEMAAAARAREALRSRHRAADAAGGGPLEPLVLRARAGECLFVRLVNRLPAHPPDDAHDADLPRITRLNLADLGVGAEVSLFPQLLFGQRDRVRGRAGGVSRRGSGVYHPDGAARGREDVHLVCRGDPSRADEYAGTLSAARRTEGLRQPRGTRVHG